MAENKGEVKAPQEGQDFKKFEYADVFFECNRCGHLKVLDQGIKDGLSFVLPATDKHEWRMVCDNCNNMMRLFFRASSNETIEKAKVEEARKAAEEKAKLEKENNESKKKNKKERSSKRGSKNSKRVSKSDSEGTGSVSTDK